MRNLLVRAIITGFGLRIGSELGKFVAQRIFPKEDDAGGEEEEDDTLGSTSSEPPEV